MFIGDLVKLKDSIKRNGKDQVFIENSIKEDWIWLITGIDNEGLDYIVQPIYLTDEWNITQLGGELLVLCDEIEKIDINRYELFEILSQQQCIN